MKRNMETPCEAPRSKRTTVYDTVWKNVRKDGESKYEFSSTSLLKTRYTKTQSGQKKKRSPGLSDKPDGVSEPELQPRSESMSATVLGCGCETFPYENPGESSLLTMDNPPGEVTSIEHELEEYVYCLKQHKAIAPCDCSLAKFVVQEYDHKNFCLKVHKFQFVARVAKYFQGKIFWVYSCSCDREMTNLTDSLSHSLTISHSSYEQSAPNCLHMQAAKTILEEFDSLTGITPTQELSDHNYSAKTENSNGFVPVGSDCAVCVEVDRSFGVVCLDRASIFCSTCKHGSRSCKHIDFLMDHIHNNEGDIAAALQPFIGVMPAHQSHYKPYMLQVLSRKSIPFTSTPEMKTVLRQSFQDRFDIIAGVGHFHPPTMLPCPVCGEEGQWSPEEQRSHSTTIVCSNQVFKAEVYTRNCCKNGCNGVLEFDGQEKCLVHFRHICVSYEVLRQFMFHFLLGRTTMYTEYRILEKTYADVGDIPLKTIFTYNHFRLSWYAYLSLLDIDVSLGFSCKVCGTTPDVIIMDATSLSFRRALDSWSAVFHTDGVKPRRKGSRFSDRVFIDHQEARKLLSQYCSKGIQKDVTHLLELIDTHAKCILPLLKHLISTENQSGEWRCPQPWIPFVQSLASTSPVCAYVHTSNEVKVLFKKMQTEEYDVTRTPDSMKLLQYYVPILFNLVKNLTSYPHTLLSPILQTLLDKAEAPFAGEQEVHDTKPSDLLDMELHHLGFFPQLPLVRNRGSYVADGNKYSEFSLCNKYSHGHPSLLPGVFTLFCQHGICYGFQVMRCHESPNTPFTVVYTRFVKAPQVAVYDNACNLHSYSLNREPIFFQNTWFLIDRFHWPNHTGCSQGYNISQYPQFSDMNTQVVEQSNSLLKRIKSSVSYMNAPNFMKHLKFYLWYHNSNNQFCTTYLQ